MEQGVSRRGLLAGAAALASGVVLEAAPAKSAAAAGKGPFRFSLNTSTIQGQKLSLPEEIDLAAKAGYDAIEPWVREIEAYVNGGGSLKDLRKRIEDNGLAVPSAIGFAEWIVDDDTRRAKGLETAKRDMDWLQQIGGQRIAAPPVGATDRTDLNPAKIAERYRALLDLGATMGIIPMVEMWGFSKTLSRLGEAALTAIEAGDPKALILADVYHLYKGGSGFGGLGLLSGVGMQVFHMNDYPANLPREQISDAHRVYPGDGIAPLPQILADLKRGGFHGYLSLELFNREYWQQDAYQVAKTGLEKLRAVAAKAG